MGCRASIALSALSLPSSSASSGRGIYLLNMVLPEMCPHFQDISIKYDSAFVDPSARLGDHVSVLSLPSSSASKEAEGSNCFY